MSMNQLKINPTITIRVPSLDKYLQEISREPLLTTSEEVALAQKIRQGGRDADKAKEKLVRGNLRFVVSVAKQYQNQGLPLTDLIEEGNMGLITAANKFDETRGFKFISYAVWWIRQCIIKAISEQSRMIRLPLNQVGILNRIRKEMAAFEQENHRAPSTAELSEILDIPESKIVDTLSAGGRHLSTDAPLGDNEDGSMLDTIADSFVPATDDTVNRESLNTEISRVLNDLQERDREIVRLFFGIGGRELSLEEIGERFNLTRERVRQIKERALRRLRSGHNYATLRSYL